MATSSLKAGSQATHGALLPALATSDTNHLRNMREPERTITWLRACFIDAPASKIKQADLCQAYRRAFENHRHLLKEPLLEPQVLLDVALQTFGSAQLEGAVDYTVRGIRTRSFCLVPEGMPTADQVREAVPHAGISLASLLKLFEHRIPPNNFDSLSKFFGLVDGVTSRHSRTGLLFRKEGRLTPSAPGSSRESGEAGAKREDKIKSLVAEFRVYPPPTLPAAEISAYCKRFLSSYSSALAFQGVAFEVRKAAQGVLRKLQQDSLHVSTSVWKSVENAEQVLSAANAKVEEMRRANEARWAAQVFPQHAQTSLTLQPKLVGSNQAVSFRQKIECDSASDGKPFVLTEGNLERWMKSMELLLVQNGLWLQCVNARPPASSHPLFATPLSKWDAKAAEAAEIMREYINPNLLSRIPAERWEHYQSRRGLAGSFLAEAPRMLPHEIRSAAIWSRHQPLAITPKFSQHGFEHLRSNVSDFYRAEHTRNVEETRTSGYYLLEQLKSYAKPFRLLDLPPELRLIIFEYSVAADGPVKVLDAVKGERFKYQHPPPLTEVSRSIRVQTLRMYYITNEFELVLDANKPKNTDSDGWETTLVRTWYRKIGDSYEKDGRYGRFLPNGRKIASLDIVRRMRGLAVTLQVRVVHRNHSMSIPAQYRMVQFRAEHTLSGGLAVSLPSNLSTSYVPAKQTLDAWYATLLQIQEDHRLLNPMLFDYFFSHGDLWNDWRLDVERRLWVGGYLAVWCTCH